MKKAIITGANGFVAKHLIQALVDEKVEVLALSRHEKLDLLPGVDPNFLHHRMFDVGQAADLGGILAELKWVKEDNIVFYHLAWKGQQSLADGSPAEQIHNIIYTADCLQVAASVGCSKFVNVGTVEELYFEDYLESSKWMEQPYYSGHGYYAASKAGAFKMNLIVAYLQKIEYVQARFSVVVSRDLESFSKGYIASTLKKLIAGMEIEPPSSKQLYELVEMKDLCEGLRELGHSGHNKQTYYIGHGAPATLADIFSEFGNVESDRITQEDQEDGAFTSFFDNSSLADDVGFVPARVSRKNFQ